MGFFGTYSISWAHPKTHNTLMQFLSWCCCCCYCCWCNRYKYTVGFNYIYCYRIELQFCCKPNFGTVIKTILFCSFTRNFQRIWIISHTKFSKQKLDFSVDTWEKLSEIIFFHLITMRNLNMIQMLRMSLAALPNEWMYIWKEIRFEF